MNFTFHKDLKLACFLSIYRVFCTNVWPTSSQINSNCLRECESVCFSNMLGSTNNICRLGAFCVLLEKCCESRNDSCGLVKSRFPLLNQALSRTLIPVNYTLPGSLEGGRGRLLIFQNFSHWEVFIKFHTNISLVRKKFPNSFILTQILSMFPMYSTSSHPHPILTPYYSELESRKRDYRNN